METRWQSAALEYENLVVLDADLAGATKTGVFKKAFPERHIDCGIAECNMMGVGGPDWQQSARFPSPAPLPCSRQAEPLSRSEIPSDIRI